MIWTILEELSSPSSPIDNSTKSNSRDLGKFTHWYLNKYFKFVKFSNNTDRDLNFTVKCIPCLPLHKILSASKLTTANLFSHIKQQHPELLRTTSTSETDSASSCSFSNSSQTSAQNQHLTSLTQPKFPLLSYNLAISQDQLNTLVFNFVVKTMQSLRIVEEPSFIDLIKTSHPTRKLLSRPTLTAMVSERFEQMKQRLIEQLANVEFVGTTADTWSAARRSFLGMTVHWLDPLSMQRHSKAISCVRLKGPHDYEALAQKIFDVHSKFQIQNKVFI